MGFTRFQFDSGLTQGNPGDTADDSHLADSCHILGHLDRDRSRACLAGGHITFVVNRSDIRMIGHPRKGLLRRVQRVHRRREFAALSFEKFQTRLVERDMLRRTLDTHNTV